MRPTPPIRGLEAPLPRPRQDTQPDRVNRTYWTPSRARSQAGFFNHGSPLEAIASPDLARPLRRHQSWISRTRRVVRAVCRAPRPSTPTSTLALSGPTRRSAVFARKSPLQASGRADRDQSHLWVYRLAASVENRLTWTTLVALQNRCNRHDRRAASGRSGCQCRKEVEKDVSGGFGNLIVAHGWV